MAVGDSQMFAWSGLDTAGLRGGDKWVTPEFCRTSGYSDGILQSDDRLLLVCSDLVAGQVTNFRFHIAAGRHRL